MLETCEEGSFLQCLHSNLQRERKRDTKLALYFKCLQYREKISEMLYLKGGNAFGSVRLPDRV